MPVLILVVVVFVVVLLLIALLPLSLVQRYRIGTMRRPARGWVATLNVVGLAISAGMFLVGAALTNVWVPDAFAYTLTGLTTGCLLGLLGLVLSRWEVTPRAVYYTPNKWLVLGITLVVTGRLVYGFWRAWQSWRMALDGTSWIATAGVGGSLAAGAVVLGYYLVYWAGVRRRLTAWQRRRPGGA